VVLKEMNQEEVLKEMSQAAQQQLNHLLKMSYCLAISELAQSQ